MTRCKILLILSLFAFFTRSVEAIAAQGPVLEVKIAANEPESDVISFEAGRDSGISVGDLFWIVDANVCRFGTIYFTTEGACVGRFLQKNNKPPCSATAYVLLHTAVAELREQFPPSATIRGKISRLPKDGTALISMGRSSGLKLNDTILVRREGIPIARGRILVIEAGAATITLQALVTNAIAQADDPVELWPAPGDRSFRVNSTVLLVTAAKEGDVITIVGDADDGYAEGRQVDLFHGDEFVGVASILKMDGLPVSRAKMTNAETRGNPAEGDWAYVRLGAGPPLSPLSAVIFRVVQDYCLVAAGEVDGVKRGEKLQVFGKGNAKKAVAEITIDKVNVDYSGGSVRILDAAAAPLQVWNFAERIEPRRARWDEIGEVKNVDPKWRVCGCSLKQGVTVTAGSVIGLSGQGSEQVAGLIVTPVSDGALVYIPPGWGDLDRLKGARVMMAESRDNRAASTQPTSSQASDEENDLGM
jgi:hypothetical protein